MASDSRVSWIDTGSNIPNKWFDSDDYLKTITNSKLELSNFRYHMLKNILYIGDDNLIYWIDILWFTTNKSTKYSQKPGYVYFP